MKQLLSYFIALLCVLSPNIIFADTISIENAYVREIPPGVSTSASFLTLKNSSNTAVALIKVTSDIAKNVELHEHVHKDGMMEMRQVEKIIIPAKGQVELKPGGYHIMLIGLTKMIMSGDRVALTLEFDNGTKQALETVVKNVMQGMKKNNMKAVPKTMAHPPS